METLDVIFRAERDTGEVTAVFPSEPGVAGSLEYFTVYSSVGQHGTGSLDWYRQTRRASEDEYSSLLEELRSIYESGEDAVTLRVVRRMTYKHWEDREAAT